MRERTSSALFAIGDLVTSTVDQIYRGRVYEVIGFGYTKVGRCPTLKLKYHSGPGMFMTVPRIYAESICVKVEEQRT